MSTGVRAIMREVEREVVRQGATVSWGSGGALRIKCANGRVVKVHSSPSASQHTTRLKQLLRHAGVQEPEGGWKF